jgi:hypothetical protein
MTRRYLSAVKIDYLESKTVNRRTQTSCTRSPRANYIFAVVRNVYLFSVELHATLLVSRVVRWHLDIYRCFWNPIYVFVIRDPNEGVIVGGETVKDVMKFHVVVFNR